MDSVESPSGLRSAVYLVFALASSVSFLWAQANGDIRLEVKDPSGAVTRASGTLRNLDTGAERTFETDAQGSFDFASLPYGQYQIRISKNGFVTQTVRVEVRSAAPVSQTVTLALGSQRTSLDVISIAPLSGTTIP